MEDLTKNEDKTIAAKSTKAPVQPKAGKNKPPVELDRPEAPADAVKAATNVTAEAVVTKVTPKAAPKTGDRPVASKDAKPSPKPRAKKAPAAKAPAAKTKTSDRPVVVTAKCDCCGRDEVLEPWEVVKDVTINICMVCKETINSKVEAMTTAGAA